MGFYLGKTKSKIEVQMLLATLGNQVKGVEFQQLVEYRQRCHVLVGR